jgi:two-component system, sensor histidine kinase and response regulator
MTKILVIEDEALTRNVIVETLQWSGFTTITADNGRIGLQLAQEELPDLIICDVSMPEIDGFELLSLLKQDQKTVNIPFIFLTAQAGFRQSRQGMNLGADDYLPKPFDLEELNRTIKTQLNKKAARKKEQLTQLNELCVNITGSLPQELHTSLNGILGTTELLLTLDDSIDYDDRRELLEVINDSAQRLQCLTENFWFYTRLVLIHKDQDKLKQLRGERLSSNVKGIVESITKSLAKQWQRKDDLQLNLETADLSIAETDFQKIVYELVDNACKFSPPGKPIQINSQSQKGNLTLTVNDQGKGMTAEQIANIGAFRQFDRHKYEQQGLGLGLVIVKLLVELYHGKFIIASTPNIGTSIEISLPIVN